jgi:hypothetical protein
MTPSPETKPSPQRNPNAGVGRVGGILATMITAAVVFVAGMRVLPPIVGAPPPPPPLPAAAPPVMPPPPPTPADAASTDAAGASPDAAANPAAAPPAGPANHRTAAADREKAADKDVAREAWRKNLPDISLEGPKASMLIPIRGSIEGASYHVANKPKSVIVNLPAGESMITMRFYKIRREGFRQLWIKQEEGVAGATLRVVLDEASDPQVEIKDDFVRVTVRRPAETATPPPAPAAASEAAPDAQ